MCHKTQPTNQPTSQPTKYLLPSFFSSFLLLYCLILSFFLSNIYFLLSFFLSFLFTHTFFLSHCPLPAFHFSSNTQFLSFLISHRLFLSFYSFTSSVSFFPSAFSSFLHIVCVIRSLSASCYIFYHFFLFIVSFVFNIDSYLAAGVVIGTDGMTFHVTE